VELRDQLDLTDFLVRQEARDLRDPVESRVRAVLLVPQELLDRRGLRVPQDLLDHLECQAQRVRQDQTGSLVPRVNRVFRVPADLREDQDQRVL